MRHVLVIEDDRRIADRVTDLVVDAGASSVDVVSDEAAAVEAATRHRPSVIVSDIDLREGGRGPDAVERIRALYGAVPTIFVTADPSGHQVDALSDTILIKPVSANAFASTFLAITGDLARWRELAESRALVPAQGT
ncbi:MAG: response regulator [Sphingomonas phyllosphaerae]